MKTLKLLTAALLMVLSFGAFASDDTKSEKLMMDYPVKTYINAITHGKLKGLSEILDQDVKFTITRNNNIYNYQKSEMLEHLKQLKNIEQNCTTNYNIIELAPSQALVKVTMKYEGFSRINLVSLSNTSKGWKITNVSSSFN